MKPIYLLSYLLCFLSIRSFGQSMPIDSTLKDDAFAHTISGLYTAISSHSRIYNGPDYAFYNPYFMDAKNIFSQGSLLYDGVFYDKVPMLYDLHKDLVVVQLYNNFLKYTLIADKVQWFNLLAHHFVYINADTLDKSTLKTGFYDQLYKGKIEILVRREKSIQTATKEFGRGMEDYFEEATNFFLKRGNTYYKVNGQGAFINALKDRQKEIKQYLKSNKIKFSADPESAMVKIAAYYDHLTN
jgi:hypothetical protein